MNGRERGFTLVEVLVAMVFFLICSVGLLSFTMLSLGERKSIEKRQQAYAVAFDIAERLRSLPSGSDLVRPTPSHEGTYLCYREDTGVLVLCNTSQEVMTSTYGNPVGSGTLYLYDANHDGVFDTSELNVSANAEVDHPNDTATGYDAISPVRRMTDGTTFYGMWSVRYFPLNYNDQAKVFITVYWIEPEPKDGSPGNVVAGINSGSYRLKRVTITTDRAYKVAR